MSLDLTIEHPPWSTLDLQHLAECATTATLRHLGLDPDNTEIALLACDDGRIAELNAGFRDRPTPTNVLSWPALDLAPTQPGAVPRPPEPDFTGELALGDIAIAWETCTREATEGGIPLADHVTHLIVHGLLHLLGYDHIRDADATLMERLEVQVLGTLGVDDPYREATGA